MSILLNALPALASSTGYVNDQISTISYFTRAYYRLGTTIGYDRKMDYTHKDIFLPILTWYGTELSILAADKFLLFPQLVKNLELHRLTQLYSSNKTGFEIVKSYPTIHGDGIPAILRNRLKNKNYADIPRLFIEKDIPNLVKNVPFEKQQALIKALKTSPSEYNRLVDQFLHQGLISDTDKKLLQEAPVTWVHLNRKLNYKNFLKEIIVPGILARNEVAATDNTAGKYILNTQEADFIINTVKKVDDFYKSVKEHLILERANAEQALRGKTPYSDFSKISSADQLRYMITPEEFETLLKSPSQSKELQPLVEKVFKSKLETFNLNDLEHTILKGIHFDKLLDSDVLEPINKSPYKVAPDIQNKMALLKHWFTTTSKQPNSDKIKELLTNIADKSINLNNDDPSKIINSWIKTNLPEEETLNKLSRFVREYFHSQDVTEKLKYYEQASVWPRTIIGLIYSALIVSYLGNLLDIKGMMKWQSNIVKEGKDPTAIIWPSVFSFIPALAILGLGMKNPALKKLGSLYHFGVTGALTGATYIISTLALTKARLAKDPRTWLNVKKVPKSFKEVDVKAPNFEQFKTAFAKAQELKNAPTAKKTNPFA